MQYGSLPKLKLNFDFKFLWEFIEIYLVGQREVEILASSKKIPFLSPMLNCLLSVWPGSRGTNKLCCVEITPYKSLRGPWEWG